MYLLDNTAAKIPGKRKEKYNNITRKMAMCINIKHQSWRLYYICVLLHINISLLLLRNARGSQADRETGCCSSCCTTNLLLLQEITIRNNGATTTFKLQQLVSYQKLNILFVEFLYSGKYLYINTRERIVLFTSLHIFMNMHFVVCVRVCTFTSVV